MNLEGRDRSRQQSPGRENVSDLIEIEGNLPAGVVGLDDPIHLASLVVDDEEAETPHSRLTGDPS